MRLTDLLLTSTLLCQGATTMRSRLFSFAPSLRIEMVSSMLKYKLALKRYVYLLYLAQQDPRTMVLDNRTRSVGLKDDLIL